MISKSDDILEKGARRVLRRIFTPKGGITSGRRKLHDEGLHSLYASQNAVLLGQ
jgi:hypothetical protein